MRIFRKLAQLLDVDLTTNAPADGDSLTYDAASSQWVPEAVSGGAGSDNQTAAEVPFTPAGNISSSNVQDALEEVDTEKVTQTAVDSSVATHSADTTSVHGIADTSTLYRSGGTDVAIADGGTGASTAAGARANLDLEAGTDFPSLTTFNDHSARHENGGGDEISVAGLSGLLADPQTPTAHHASHENGGSDELSVAGLSGELADPQPTDATKVDSGVATDGQILTADGAGGAAWEDAPAGGSGAPTDATYITQTANGSLSAEQALSSLTTGIVKVTNGTGVLSTATEGTDYTKPGGTDVALADGGTGTSLSDPNADRIMFWDDSAGHVDWLTAGTGLSISGTTISASGGGGGTRQAAVTLTNPQVSANAGNSFYTTLGLTDWDAGHWEFVKDVDGKIYGVVKVPPDYSSGGALKVSIAANATSGVTRLGVGTKAVADGESLNPGSLTDETNQDITVPGTAYLRKVVSFTLTETLAASDLLIVEIYHNGAHANDTLAVNTLLFGAWLEYTA